MRLPAIAKQAYDRLKEDSDFLKLTERIVSKLEKIKKPEARARAVFKELNLAIEKLFRSEVVQKAVTCNKGCAGCCHSLVGVTSEEAELLANKIQRGEVHVDLSLMSTQATVSSNPQAWYRLPYSQRACPFLDQGTQSCKVYEDRPGVCRSNFAVSDPSFCAGEKGEMRLLNTDKASMILIGAFMSTAESGELPKMVWNRLSEKYQEKGRKESIFDVPF